MCGVDRSIGSSPPVIVRFQPLDACPISPARIREVRVRAFKLFQTFGILGDARAKGLRLTIICHQRLTFRQQSSFAIEQHLFSVFFVLAVEKRWWKMLAEQVLRPGTSAVHALRILW